MEAALHADWARVLTNVQDDACCTFIVDVSTPTARTQLLPILVRDPDVRAKVVATSAEAPDRGFVEDAPELQPPADSAAETGPSPRRAVPRRTRPRRIRSPQPRRPRRRPGLSRPATRRRHRLLAHGVRACLT
ncbi:hypothetical protein ACFQZC_08320 [Streptacidiphilus monticola]